MERKSRPLRAAAAAEIVVARYNEPSEWTRNTPRSFAVTLYDKGGDLDDGLFPGITIEPLPNVGREAHSYLHHVVRHYDELLPVTVFCQGHPFDHAHDLHAFLRELHAGATRIDGFRWLGFIIDSDDPRGCRLFVPWSKNPDRRELKFDEFHRLLFQEGAPLWTHFHVGAQFAVTREQIHRRPRSFYEHALALAVTFPDGAACFERVWDRVFSARGVDSALLAGELCRYLKPIRRLTITSSDPKRIATSDP